MQQTIDPSQHPRILVAGGHGFLGRHVLGVLADRGYTDVLTPRSRAFDLTHEAAVERLLDQTRPTAILHLAAVVGGIGANRENLDTSRARERFGWQAQTPFSEGLARTVAWYRMQRAATREAAAVGASG